MHCRFFSFVVPAHNEELIIDRTLTCLKNLDYPKDRYEVIVVENGSNDATYQKAERFASSTFRIFSSKERGVSRARNFGKTKCSFELDWCIFMDADVFLKESFLCELNDYLEAHPKVGYGTTTVWLDSNKWIASFWSFLNNFSYRMFKVLFTIHIVRKDLLPKASYDESLTSGEDIVYGRALAKYGKFFSMKTRAVFSSARRFEKKGYINMFFINMFHGIAIFVLPKKMLGKVGWEVIR